MKKSILLAILLICTSFHVHAKTPIEEHITAFISEFSSNNIKGTASRFFTESPHFIFGPHILTPKNSKQVEKILSEIHDALAEKGYMNSEIVSFETHFQNGNMSVTTILLKRYTSEGLLLDHQCSTYTLAETTEGWKILSWLPSEVKDNTRCFASES
ncbi:YkuS family protein [Microbulbifer variabilis]|uniref:YkuS family protein n=1 Tax=Microbulbifer variabilis TaxID=266805 RepID=UPI001CFF24A1|nr:YkuS family protein [Microbulbifer variabilis]